MSRLPSAGKLVTALLAVSLSSPAVAQSPPLPSGFVYLRDLAPAIVQDIRYFGADNFTARPLPGYDAAECILRRDAAAALGQVQSDLAPLGFRLKVYDCYRPARASRAMLQWAKDKQAGHAERRFFPAIEKQQLFALGYIAARSAHSAGIAVDLSLVETAAPASSLFDPAARYGSCSGPAEQRAPDNSLDMGTGYDCFDLKSHTASGAITARQKRHRALLVAVMRKRGFQNYHREWWHFSYATGAPIQYYDFPIRAGAAARAGP